ncbi:MAG TPA: Lpg1974 family pore-forming outer membrane protein [Pirellulales bacterium]|nr:Lpg1974 family pore-forming outer membrane protein [Pirellulales bacterium]
MTGPALVGPSWQGEGIAAGQPLMSPTLTPPVQPLSIATGAAPADPPVPYYSGIPAVDDLPADSPTLEIPGFKLGWIATAEVGYVQPFISNHLQAAGVGALPGTVGAPAAQPDWLVLPKIDFGYRWPQGLGEFHVIARYLQGQGTETFAHFDSAGAGVVTSHLSLYTLDLDYAFLEFNPGRVRLNDQLYTVPGRLGLRARPENEPPPYPLLKWFYGARLANVYFDSRGAGSQVLSERVMNNFAGAGARVGLEFTQPLPGRCWSVYSRLEFSGLFGTSTQSFDRTQITGGGTVSGSARQSANGGVPVVSASLGARYVPMRWPGLGLSAGYQFEQWWYLGTGSSSDAGLTLQGVFLRSEFNF